MGLVIYVYSNVGGFADCLLYYFYAFFYYIAKLTNWLSRQNKLFSQKAHRRFKKSCCTRLCNSSPN